MGFQSSTALLNAIFIHLWVGLTTHNYLKAVTTDPGTAPKDWVSIRNIASEKTTLMY
jgi:hypothetical protein